MPSIDPAEAGRRGGSVRSERKAAANRAHGFKKREPGASVQKPLPVTITIERKPAPTSDPATLPFNELESA
jgi:hypothetical protein